MTGLNPGLEALGAVADPRRKRGVRVGGLAGPRQGRGLRVSIGTAQVVQKADKTTLIGTHVHFRVLSSLGSLAGTQEDHAVAVPHPPRPTTGRGQTPRLWTRLAANEAGRAT
jgi:hypothetical protein